MPEIGLRELKARASAILRDVRERRMRYTVTYRGRAVGVLLPIDEVDQARADQNEVWDELVRLGKDIGSGWRLPRDSAQLLSESRR